MSFFLPTRRCSVQYLVKVHHVKGLTLPETVRLKNGKERVLRHKLLCKCSRGKKVFATNLVSSADAGAEWECDLAFRATLFQYRSNHTRFKEKKFVFSVEDAKGENKHSVEVDLAAFAQDSSLVTTDKSFSLQPTGRLYLSITCEDITKFLDSGLDSPEPSRIKQRVGSVEEIPVDAIGMYHIPNVEDNAPERGIIGQAERVGVAEPERKHTTEDSTEQTVNASNEEAGPVRSLTMTLQELSPKLNHMRQLVADAVSGSDVTPGNPAASPAPLKKSGSANSVKSNSFLSSEDDDLTDPVTKALQKLARSLEIDAALQAGQTSTIADVILEIDKVPGLREKLQKSDAYQKAMVYVRNTEMGDVSSIDIAAVRRSFSQRTSSNSKIELNPDVRDTPLTFIAEELEQKGGLSPRRTSTDDAPTNDDSSFEGPNADAISQADQMAADNQAVLDILKEDYEVRLVFQGKEVALGFIQATPMDALFALRSIIKAELDHVPDEYYFVVGDDITSLRRVKEAEENQKLLIDSFRGDIIRLGAPGGSSKKRASTAAAKSPIKGRRKSKRGSVTSSGQFSSSTLSSNSSGASLKDQLTHQSSNTSLKDQNTGRSSTASLKNQSSSRPKSPGTPKKQRSPVKTGRSPKLAGAKRLSTRSSPTK